MKGIFCNTLSVSNKLILVENLQFGSRDTFNPKAIDHFCLLGLTKESIGSH